MANLPVKRADGTTVYMKATGTGADDANAFVVQHLETNSAAMLTSLQLLDDMMVTDNAAFTDGTTKLGMAGFIYDETAGTALTENDAAAARIDVKRAIVIAVEDATTRGRRMTVDASGRAAVLATQTGTWNTVDAGDVAHDAADSGNPVKVGGVARSSQPTKVASGDRVNAYFDLVGRIVTTPYVPRELVGRQVTTLTNTTSETTIITAGGANVFNDITHLAITNKSATGTVATLKDGTGGTTAGIFYIPAGSGMISNYTVPLPQASANANWTLTLGTSVDSVYVTTAFAKNA